MADDDGPRSAHPGQRPTMEVQTDTERVRLSRKMVLEFLGSSVDLSTAPAAAVAPVQPSPPASDRFAACPFHAEDFKIGTTQYTPDKYLQEGFDGSTARAALMLKDRLNEARQIAGNIGGAALTEVQRQSRVLDYFMCRLKIEQASQK